MHQTVQNLIQIKEEIKEEEIKEEEITEEKPKEEPELLDLVEDIEIGGENPGSDMEFIKEILKTVLYHKNT